MGNTFRFPREFPLFRKVPQVSSLVSRVFYIQSSFNGDSVACDPESSTHFPNTFFFFSRFSLLQCAAPPLLGLCKNVGIPFLLFYVFRRGFFLSPPCRVSWLFFSPATTPSLQPGKRVAFTLEFSPVFPPAPPPFSASVAIPTRAVTPPLCCGNPRPYFLSISFPPKITPLVSVLRRR